MEALRWLDSNNMIANPDNFKSIVLKKPQMKTNHVNITVGNLEIKLDTSVKLLRLEIEDNLNFRKYFKQMC